jgi:hypothetical protein
MTYGASDKHKPWGLTVPGRPPTPSEGAAQVRFDLQFKGVFKTLTDIEAI